MSKKWRECYFPDGKPALCCLLLRMRNRKCAATLAVTLLISCSKDFHWQPSFRLWRQSFSICIVHVVFSILHISFIWFHSDIVQWPLLTLMLFDSRQINKFLYYGLHHGKPPSCALAYCSYFIFVFALRLYYLFLSNDMSTMVDQIQWQLVQGSYHIKPIEKKITGLGWDSLDSYFNLKLIKCAYSKQYYAQKQTVTEQKWAKYNPQT